MTKNSPLILTVVGMLGSGKGTCTEYLENTYQFPVVHFGRMVYDEIRRRGLDIVKDEKMVREDMRAKEGKAVLAKRAAAKARELIADGHHIVVLDGMYSWSEHKHLEGEFGKRLVVLAVVAPKESRRQRALARKDGHHQTYTYDQLVAREIAEIENLEKGGPIAYADYTLNNNKDQAYLLEQLEEILAQLTSNSGGA